MQARLTVVLGHRSNDAEICITAELPGISMDDAEHSIEGNRTTVSVEKKSDVEEKDGERRRFYRVERTLGPFWSEIKLSFDSDPDSVKAQAPALTCTRSARWAAANP